MIRKAEQKDAPVLAALAIQMWKDDTLTELEEGFSALLKQNDVGLFLKYAEDDCAGFAQCQLRYDYVEGTHTSPVGYLEGIFVEERYRKQGFAKELLHECEDWAKEKGCREFVSDCELSNAGSYRFHIAMGFEEANRILCFRKKL